MIASVSRDVGSTETDIIMTHEQLVEVQKSHKDLELLKSWLNVKK